MRARPATPPAMRRLALAAACWIGVVAGSPVWAQADDAAPNAPDAAQSNPMGYRLVTPQDAAALPKNGGKLGLDLQRAEFINDRGIQFELMRVTAVHGGSAGARAGFRNGDELISVNGRVFPSLAVFGAYVGSLPPGQPANFDYIPAGGGPAQAQRVKVVLGNAVPPGMSTREKVAIGVGAAALFGCYELGCFKHRQAAPPPPSVVPPQPVQR